MKTKELQISKLGKLLLLLLLLSVCASSVYASNPIVFTSTIDVKWSTPGNWSTGALPTPTDDVVIDGECELDQDATVASLSVNEGKTITIKSGKILCVTETITTTDVSQLVIEDHGQLVHNDGTALATVHKHINSSPDADNPLMQLIASPVTDNDSVENINFHDYILYTFDPYNIPQWVDQSENPIVEFKKGYMYATIEETTLAFKGTLAAATDPTPLDYEGNVGNIAVNLIGNPYPCNAYVKNSYYRLNAEGTSLIAEAGAINPCESVFVVATAPGQNVEFGKSAMATELIKISLLEENGALIDQVVVRFDDKDDLYKIILNDESTTIYVRQDGTDFASVSISLEEGNLPLYFKTYEDASYTLNISVENMEMYYLHLVDNLMGMDVDVLNGSQSYSFSASTTDYLSRFKLVFNKTGVDENGSEPSFAFVSNGNLILNGVGENATIQIVDMLGRVVRNENIGDRNSIPLGGMKTGVYVLLLEDGARVKTQKIVIE